MENQDIDTLNYSGNVCYVDDEKVNLMVTKGVLSKKHNYRVTTYQNPLKALEEFKNNSELINQYDAFLVDCEMPEMKGFQLAQKLREINPRVKIILYTTNSTDSIKEYALQKEEELKKTIQRYNNVEYIFKNKPKEEKNKKLESRLLNVDTILNEKPNHERLASVLYEEVRNKQA